MVGLGAGKKGDFGEEGILGIQGQRDKYYIIFHGKQLSKPAVLAILY